VDGYVQTVAFHRSTKCSDVVERYIYERISDPKRTDERPRLSALHLERGQFEESFTIAMVMLAPS